MKPEAEGDEEAEPGTLQMEVFLDQPAAPSPHN